MRLRTQALQGIGRVPSSKQDEPACFSRASIPHQATLVRSHNLGDLPAEERRAFPYHRKTSAWVSGDMNHAAHVWMVKMPPTYRAAAERRVVIPRFPSMEGIWLQRTRVAARQFGVKRILAPVESVEWTAQPVLREKTMIVLLGWVVLDRRISDFSDGCPGRPVVLARAAGVSNIILGLELKRVPKVTDKVGAARVGKDRVTQAVACQIQTDTRWNSDAWSNESEVLHGIGGATLEGVPERRRCRAVALGLDGGPARALGRGRLGPSVARGPPRRGRSPRPRPDPSRLLHRPRHPAPGHAPLGGGRLGCP